MESIAFEDQDLILNPPPLKFFLLPQSLIELALSLSSTPFKVPIWLHGFFVFAPAPCLLHPASSSHLPEEQDGQVAPECKGFQRISCYVSWFTQRVGYKEITQTHVQGSCLYEQKQ